MSGANESRSVSFYHRETGLLHDAQLTTSDASNVDMNTPDGYAAIDGHHDRLSRRVDVATGEVVDYQPPQPGADHDWNDTSKRWELCPSAQATLAGSAAARARIAALEASQHGLVRRHVLGDATAVEGLRAIDDEIVKLTAEL